MVARGHVWLPGGMHGCRGGMYGCRGVVSVVVGGHAWLQGACIVDGGMCGCRGACMVVGGHAWLLGGLHRI